MSRKLVVALFAFLYAIVAAWAEPGGDGGCVNLPGGRGGSRPGSNSGGVWQTKVIERDGVLFRLPSEMGDAAVLVRGATLPFAFLTMTEKGALHVSAAMLDAVRRANEAGFVLEFINPVGECLTALALVQGSQLQVFVE